MGEKRVQLGVNVITDVLDMVGLVGLPEQQCVRPMVLQAMFGEEMRITRRDDAFAGQ